MASYRRGYENNRQRNRAFPRPSGMSDPMQRLELMPDYQPMQPMPRPMEATPMPEGYKPIRPMPPRSYGDDVRNIPLPAPRMRQMNEEPGRDEGFSDKMNRMMELLKRSAQPNADTQYTPPRPQSLLEEMSEKLNPGMHTQDTETTERVGREQREAKEFFRNNPDQQPISQSDRNLTPDIEMSTKTV